MNKKRKKSRKNRGYPLAIMIGFEIKKAVMWQIFSKTVKPLDSISIAHRREKLAENELFNFHELVIDKLRPYFKEGIRSIIIVQPRNSHYSEIFQEHIKKHHKWLTQKTSVNLLSIGTIEGSVSNAEDVFELHQTEELQKIITETTTKETLSIIKELEERLNRIDQGEIVLYSLQKIEDLTYQQWTIGKRQPEYVMLSDSFLNNHKQKPRLHRLLQILNNKKVNTKIIDAETAAGERINQFGGLICFTKK
ncbi:MAG: hypothetical protein ACTSXA_09590 [Candidatus Heimdallarchaeota archaeon]